MKGELRVITPQICSSMEITIKLKRSAGQLSRSPKSKSISGFRLMIADCCLRQMRSRKWRSRWREISQLAAVSHQLFSVTSKAAEMAPLVFALAFVIPTSRKEREKWGTLVFLFWAWGSLPQAASGGVLYSAHQGGGIFS
jgi:hypothetical protein